jgi:diketogulonate reductase-like aldo/keto reductase
MLIMMNFFVYYLDLLANQFYVYGYQDMYIMFHQIQCHLLRNGSNLLEQSKKYCIVFCFWLSIKEYYGICHIYRDCIIS